NFVTADGTAVAGQDYVARSGTITFLAGQTITSVAIDLIEDGAVEATETFSLVVTPVVSIADSVDNTGTSSLLNDDTPINGTPAADILVGSALSETINGFAGNDIINGRAGSDIMSGGAGNDTYIVDNIGDTVIEQLGEGADLIRTSVGYTLSANVEDGELLGSASINLVGNDLNNTLVGNSAANVLLGGLGSDILNGRAGADNMRGGAGNDTYIVDNAGDAVFEVAGGGTDFVRTAVNRVLSANVENGQLLGSGNLYLAGN
ncbi:Calx-beta domain-containing protein, partial [Roseibium sp. FZY0029]|uniref:Calx-beta domain-containing protein n=1 Tax=Roseibium sp. FZY0029 TaxID=3116647 RepID=UPI002EB6EF01|nr:Calx-beta domain-containing protein [Roseibium sp. FZY0029]